MKKLLVFLILFFASCSSQFIKDYNAMHEPGGPYDANKCRKARIYYEKYGSNEYLIEVRDACREVTFDKLIYQYLVQPQVKKEKREKDAAAKEK